MYCGHSENGEDLFTYSIILALYYGSQRITIA